MCNFDNTDIGISSSLNGFHLFQENTTTSNNNNNNQNEKVEEKFSKRENYAEIKLF